MPTRLEPTSSRSFPGPAASSPAISAGCEPVHTRGCPTGHAGPCPLFLHAGQLPARDFSPSHTALYFSTSYGSSRLVATFSMKSSFTVQPSLIPLILCPRVLVLWD